MAFAGDLLVAGSYHGFNIYRLSDGGLPRLLSSVVCPGGQGDVSIVGNLLIVSVEQIRGRVDCGLEGVKEVQTHAAYCMPPGLEEIRKAVAARELDRVVVAACSPRTHETL